MKESDANAVSIENAAVYKMKVGHVWVPTTDFRLIFFLLFQNKPLQNVQSVAVETVKPTFTKPDNAGEPSSKKEFIRDRIAKKKEIEDAELGVEENDTNEKNEVFVDRDEHVGGWNIHHHYGSFNLWLPLLQMTIYSVIHTF